MNDNDQKIYWNISKELWAMSAIIVMIIAYTFMDTISNMVYKWDVKEEYGYGYIIPFVTLFLIWQRKDKLSKIEFRPTYWAVPGIVLAGFMYFIGAVATTHTLSQYALVLTILCVAYGALGWHAFKIVAIPLIVLFFMVPLPPFIYNNLSTKLQLISSELGVAVIRMFDISVYLEGNVIDLGVFKLQVVEACSGLRYLFPLVSLSFVAAYLFNVEFWKRAVVFLSSIPITVLMNSFRIGVIGVLVEYGGIEQAEGFLHDFEGWIIFMACMGILFIEMAILVRIGPVKKKLVDVFTIDFPEAADDSGSTQSRKLSNVHFAIIITLLCVMASSFYVEQREDIVMERKKFASFPLSIDGWEGRMNKLEQIFLDDLKLDDYIMSDYSDNKGNNVNFYIAYYESQQAGEAAHSPKACIPGGGWLIDNLSTINLEDVKFDGKPLSTNRLIIKKGDYGQLVYYWFQQRNRIITNEYMVKWYLFWDALTRNRTDGALVRLTTIVDPGEDITKADERLTKFASQVLPLMSDYIPE